jgi:hypothetical protein
MTSLIHLQSLVGAPLGQIEDLLNLEVTRDNARVRGNLRVKMTVQWDPNTKKVVIKKMSATKEVKISRWNCRSLGNKLSNFKLHIYATKPHVVCLSETWLSQNHEPKVVKYSAVYKHREAPQPGGGHAYLFVVMSHTWKRTKGPATLSSRLS